MSQNYVYPSSSQVTIAAVGSTGAIAPAQAIEIGGVDGGGILRAVSTDSSGTVNVNVLTLAPVTGTVTANQGTAAALASAWPVKLTDGTLVNTFTANGLKIDGSAVTQPISAVSLPLPAGASTSAKQPDFGIAGTASVDVITIQGIAGMTPLLIDGSGATQPMNLTQVGGAAITLGAKVSASSLPVVLASDETVPISAVALPLPAGAATSAKQPNFGTAGLPSADVLTIQGVSSMTALKVDGAGGSFPVSGTVTANQGTANATPWNENVAQINGVTPLMGNGVTGTGSLRVTVASDNTPFTVNSKAATPTAGTITQAAITVGTSAVRLTVSGSAPSAARTVLVVTPDSASTASFYIGSSSVANAGASRGVQIVAGQTFTANSDAGDYYIISSTASQTVYVMEQA